jgi:hypothetical protein
VVAARGGVAGAVAVLVGGVLVAVGPGRRKRGFDNDISSKVMMLQSRTGLIDFWCRYNYSFKDIIYRSSKPSLNIVPTLPRHMPQ